MMHTLSDPDEDVTILDAATTVKALEIGERLARDENKGSRYRVTAETIGKRAAQVIKYMKAELDVKEGSK